MADETWYHRVYRARTSAELRDSYDGWASSYDVDLLRSGYRAPAMVAGAMGRHVPVDATPILEGAAGTGLVAEILLALGYRGLVGFDLSPDMLEVARRKGFYDALHVMCLGERLDFPDHRFAASLVTGAFTRGHAPPEGFRELIRVTRPGGVVIFTVRVDDGVSVPYVALQDALQAEGRWSLVERSGEFQTLPLAEPEVRHRVFVYRVS